MLKRRLMLSDALFLLKGMTGRLSETQKLFSHGKAGSGTLRLKVAVNSIAAT